jgi:hypothetical protein
MPFIKLLTKNNVDEITTVIKTSGTNDFATHNGVSKKVGTSSRIKTVKSQSSNMGNNATINFFPCFSNLHTSLL